MAAHAEFGAQEDVVAFVRVGCEPSADEVFGVAVFVGCMRILCERGDDLRRSCVDLPVSQNVSPLLQAASKKAVLSSSVWSLLYMLMFINPTPIRGT